MLRLSLLLPAFVLALITGCVLDGGARSCDELVCGDHASCGGEPAECFCDAGFAGNPYDGCSADQPGGGGGGGGQLETCDDIVCGTHASCGGEPAECFCDAGYAGNPYDGCAVEQPVVDDTCALDCGQNAYCSEGACYCELDHVAVCGANAGCLPDARRCDGQQDCPNGADEQLAACSAAVFQDWLVTDDCDDGLPIEWRLFSQDRDWSWPGATSTFKTTGLGAEDHETVQCFQGELICFAGLAGDVVWGFNLDGTGSCDACCAECGSSNVLDLGFLTCG